MDLSGAENSIQSRGAVLSSAEKSQSQSKSRTENSRAGVITAEKGKEDQTAEQARAG
jgi:hypothetical protein